MTKLIGYRVSTVDQDTRPQFDALAHSTPVYHTG